MSKFIEVDSFTDLKDERHEHLLKASPYITGEMHGRKYIVAYIHEHHYVAYVNVPKGSDVYGIDYNWLHQDYPSVNGEVTWSGSVGICDDDYYIGWDYAHSRDKDRHISEDEVMHDVSNCAEWINKPEHKVVCDHCNREVTKGRLLSVKDRKNLRLVSHYLRWLHCQVHSGLYQGDQEAWQIIESIIGHPAYADDDNGISRTDTHKFNDKDVIADESYTRVPNTVHKQLLKGGYHE